MFYFLPAKFFETSRQSKQLWKIGVVLLLLSISSGCAIQSQKPVPLLLENVTYRSVTELDVEEPDQIFQYGDDDAQQIWFYQANTNSEFKGVVIFIHGGCWLSQFDIGHTQALSHALSNYGYAVWNIEYRRTGNGGEWPVALDDIRHAIARLAIEKAESLDLSRVILAGHSAGGHLAMLASASPALLGLPPHTRLKTIGLAPIVDIEAYAKGENSCQIATPAFMQGTVEERRAEYSQASLLNKALDPQHTYVLLGEQDKIVAAEFTKHPDAQEYRVAGAGHFDWIHPGTHAFKQLILVLDKEN